MILEAIFATQAMQSSTCMTALDNADANGRMLPIILYVYMSFDCLMLFILLCFSWVACCAISSEKWWILNAYEEGWWDPSSVLWKRGLGHCSTEMGPFLSTLYDSSALCKRGLGHCSPEMGPFLPTLYASSALCKRGLGHCRGEMGPFLSLLYAKGGLATAEGRWDPFYLCSMQKALN